MSIMNIVSICIQIIPQKTKKYKWRENLVYNSNGGGSYIEVLSKPFGSRAKFPLWMLESVRLVSGVMCGIQVDKGSNNIKPFISAETEAETVNQKCTFWLESFVFLFCHLVSK